MNKRGMFGILLILALIFILPSAESGKNPYTPCVMSPQCSAGSTRACGTGGCGAESCNSDCQWTGTCNLNAQCWTGASQRCGGGTCGYQTCNDCVWGACYLPGGSSCFVGTNDGPYAQDCGSRIRGCAYIPDGACIWGGWSYSCSPTACCGGNTCSNYGTGTKGGCDTCKQCDGSGNCVGSNSLAGIPCGTNQVCDGSGNCLSLKIGDVYWTDMIGNRITNTNKRDTVKLVAESSANGQILNLTISSPCRKINLTSQTIIGGKVNSTWIAEYCSSGNWIFNASYKLFPIISKTAPLTVSSAADDSPPVAIILSPKNGDNFKTTDIVSFNQSSYDIDDFINWTWSFGDGQTNSIAYNITHQYTAGGPKTVTLTVNSVGRSGMAVAQVKILIDSLEDDPPLAIISSPETNEEIPIGIILFNASISIDDVTPKNKLNFTWIFGDGSTETKTGTGWIEHSYVGQRTGSYTIELTVTDERGNESTDSVTIRLTGAAGKCGNVSLGQCGKAYGLTPEEIFCSASGNLINNCTQCPCSSSKFCNNNTEGCITPDCYNKGNSGCSSGVGCFWNGTKCLDCRDILKNPANVYCSFYNGNSGDCNTDKCGLGGMSQGKCVWDTGKSMCTLQKRSTVATAECSPVMCSQSVDCQNEKYNVSCSSYPTAGKEKKCCNTCQLTKISLDGIACGGTAGISAVMPLFGWMQFIIAISIICGYYSVKSFHATNIRKRK